jgi:hypothetical protein
VPARGKKERHRTRDRRLDLVAQRRKVLSEQRAHHYRQHDELDKIFPDYALSSAIKAWHKTGTYGCFCGV